MKCIRLSAGGGANQEQKRRKNYDDKILELMRPGAHYVAENLIEALAEKGIMVTVVSLSQTLNKMSKKGIIMKVRESIYRLRNGNDSNV